MNIPSLITNVILLTFLSFIYSPNTKRKPVIAKGVGSAKNIDRAKQIAMQEARVNALEKAGIPTNVNSSTVNWESSNSSQALLSVATILSAEGKVIVEEVLEEKSKTIQNSIVEYKVTIKAKVQPYKEKPNPNLNAKIDKEPELIYKDKSILDVQITPAKPLYARLFFVNGAGEVSLGYPNEYSPSKQLQAGESILIPDNQTIQIYSDQTEVEPILVVLLFLEKDLSVESMKSGGITMNQLLNWIADIPRNEKKMHLFASTIAPKK